MDRLAPPPLPRAIRSSSPTIAALHRDKQSTPTMGGLFIIAALMASAVLFGDLRNGFVWSALLLTGGMAIVGMIDDLVKIRSPANGISARCKLLDKSLWPALSPSWSISSKPPWRMACCCGCRLPE